MTSPMSGQPRSATHRLEGVFDRTGRVRRPPLGRLAGEALSALWYDPVLPDPDQFANGRGHAVLVVPALMTLDLVTWTLRRFLERCGYRSFGWRLGVNLGPTTHLVAGLRARLAALRRLEGGPVSVVGLSLGGVLGRDLAHRCPDDVRQVITIASPFRLPTATILEPMIRRLAALYDPTFDIARLAAPTPMPAAAIYTREDGLVAWESCRGVEGSCVNIEVGGPHLTIGRNPATLRAVAEQLGEIRRSTSRSCSIGMFSGSA
jgi:pimeloyl-ACP methyl ester carboxylesterase